MGRKRKDDSIPVNTYVANGYFRWRNPHNDKWQGLGRNRESAIAYAEELNAALRISKTEERVLKRRGINVPDMDDRGLLSHGGIRIQEQCDGFYSVDMSKEEAIRALREAIEWIESCD
jgi:hypothetical protein